MGYQFKNLMCKLGNMRKAQEFTICPNGTGDDANTVVIQSDKRIARVDLNTSKAILSDGKGGHQGFMKLQPFLGAVEVDVPADMMAELKRLLPNGPDSGPIVLVG